MKRRSLVGALFADARSRRSASDRSRSIGARRRRGRRRRCRRRASKSIRCGRSRCRTTGFSARPSASRSTRRITSGSSIAPARSKPGEVHATTTPPTAQCCAPAPPVLEFDRAGNLIGHWGGPGPGLRLARFESRHHRRLQGQRLDRRQRPRTRRPRAAAAARRRRRGQNRQQDESQTGGTQSFNDNMVLKFTQDGKFLMQIGKPGDEQGQQRHREPAAAGQDVRRPGRPTSSTSPTATATIA